tara:strand:+ start:244 stop:2625 length:2382 start_codon:yes stop_codon:yes gene_type:complete
MPKKTQEDDETPKTKRYNFRRSTKKKRKETKYSSDRDDDSDSDSSSDFDPNDMQEEEEEEMNEMNTRDLQRFIQKIFPSKNGKDRLRQLDKLDKLVAKREQNKVIKNKKQKHIKKRTKEEKKKEKTDKEDLIDVECEYCNDQGCDICEEIYVDDEFSDNEDEGMKEMLGQNMKFNIIFTVGQPLGAEEYYEDEEYNELEESEYDDDDDEDYNDDDLNCINDDLIETEDDTEENIKETEKYDNKCVKLQIEDKKKKKLEKKKTKYIKHDKVDVKLKGWEKFKSGVIVKVNNHKIKRLVTYNIKLDEDGSEITKIPSRKIKKKVEEESNDVIKKLEELIETGKYKGSGEMCKQFKKMIKQKEKKEKMLQQKKDKKEKERNFIILRKLMKEKNVMNDFKFFKSMDLTAQKMIIKKFKEVNKFSQVEKPYRLTLIESDIPVEFKANALKKINTLQYMDPGTGEYYKIKQWVDTFMRIPFGKYKHLPISISDGEEKCQNFMENAKNVLDKAVYGMEDSKMQILQMVGQWISNPQSLGTAIAIKGPPGTGKTTLIKEGVSKILGRPFEFLALGGATDSSFLEGHSYTYEGSIWGKIVDILLNCKCMNPVIYFDELDKISDTPKGEEIVGILTHLTDTTQNDKFHDKYFSNIDFNLSKAMFIFSYNDETKVNSILKDRMYRIQTGGYKNDEKCIIANDYLIPNIEKNVNFEKGQIIIPSETIKYIAETLTDNEKGVRNLKRCLEIIYTKLNLYRLMKEGSTLFNKEETIKVKFPFTVTKEIVQKLIKKTNNNSAPFGMYM